MSKILSFDGGLFVQAEYSDPTIHKHLALHIMLSYDKERVWKIDGESVVAKGVCIDSDIPHSGCHDEYGTLVFLFPITSKYTPSIRKGILLGQPFCILEEQFVTKMISFYKDKRNTCDKALPKAMLDAAGIYPSERCNYDERVQEMIQYIDEQKSIETNIYDKLSDCVSLSKSRMSHLFKGETGMTIHSYLSIKRLQKALAYYEEGKSITEAAMEAGFDSPSHCSSTCKRMFGISIRDVYKTIGE